MSEIKDRQDAASDIDPIVAALADDGQPRDGQADDVWAAAAVEGFDEAAEPIVPVVEAAEASTSAGEVSSEPVADAIAEPAEGKPLAPGEAPAEASVTTDIAAGAFEDMPAAYADTIVELDAGLQRADDDAALLDSDLEDGIASVFAALHAAREDSAAVEPLGDLEAADGVTFRLLGELDRLWHRAA